MTIALFSDIHGNITALNAVLAALDDLGGADVTFAAGDLIGGCSATDEIIEVLLARGVRMVRGDSDTEDKLVRLVREAAAAPGTTRYSVDYYEQQLQWQRAHLSPKAAELLRALPLGQTLKVAAGQRLYVCHASPQGEADRVCGLAVATPVLRAAYGAVEAQVYAFGHAHVPYVRLLDGKLFVNVASVAFRADATGMLTLLTYADEQWITRQMAVPYNAEEESRLMAWRGVPTPVH